MLTTAEEDLSEVTSRVEAMSDPEEMCAKRVVEKSKQMRRFHQQLRWRISNGAEVVVAVAE